MPLFNFSLRPLDEVEPWGTAPNLILSWFGLTDGCYWIDAGGEELFRSSDEALAKWPPDPFAGPYLDYQVIRLYEDVINILPHILQPIPSSLSGHLRAARDRPSWRDAIRRVLDSDAAGEEDFELACVAEEWLDLRTIDTAYLTCGPRIVIAREDDLVTIAWDATAEVIAGLRAWDADRGSYSLPVDDFLAEVRSFEARLMGQMAARVDSIRADWGRPEIRIDLPGLIRENEARREMLNRTLSINPTAIDPDEVEAAIRRFTDRPA